MERRLPLSDMVIDDVAVTTRDKQRLAVHLGRIVLDLALVCVGFAIAHWLRYDIQLGRDIYDPLSYRQLSAFTTRIAALAGLVVVLLHIKGLYRLPRSASIFDQGAIIVSSVTNGIALLVMGLFALRLDMWSRLIMVFVWALVIIVLVGERAIEKSIRHWFWRRGKFVERTLVVGSRGLAKQVMQELDYTAQHGAQLEGYIDGPPDDRSDVTRPDAKYRWLGGFEDLKSVLERREIDQVIVALPFWAHDRLPEVVEVCRRHNVEFRVAPDLYELSFDRVNIQRLSNIPLLNLKKNIIRGWNYVFKRSMDLALIGLSAPIWGTIWGLAALAIKLSDPKAATVFTQDRVGKHGKRFRVYKLRTMVPNAENLKDALRAQNEAQGALFKIRSDPRVTRIGRILRKLSIDEIPQLYNVLKGEMSLVGPRPQVPDEVDQYEPWHYRRLEVTPGLTGLWQATGRSNTTFDDMVRLDIYYTEHWSFWLDVRIILLTIPAVLFGRGAY